MQENERKKLDEALQIIYLLPTSFSPQDQDGHLSAYLKITELLNLLLSSDIVHPKLQCHTARNRLVHSAALGVAMENRTNLLNFIGLLKDDVQPFLNNLLRNGGYATIANKDILANAPLVLACEPYSKPHPTNAVDSDPLVREKFELYELPERLLNLHHWGNQLARVTTVDNTNRNIVLCKLFIFLEAYRKLSQYQGTLLPTQPPRMAFNFLGGCRSGLSRFDRFLTMNRGSIAHGEFKTMPNTELKSLLNIIRPGLRPINAQAFQGTLNAARDQQAWATNFSAEILAPSLRIMQTKALTIPASSEEQLFGGLFELCQALENYHYASTQERSANSSTNILAYGLKLMPFYFRLAPNEKVQLLPIYRKALTQCHTALVAHYIAAKHSWSEDSACRILQSSTQLLSCYEQIITLEPANRATLERPYREALECCLYALRAYYDIIVRNGEWIEKSGRYSEFLNSYENLARQLHEITSPRRPRAIGGDFSQIEQGSHTTLQMGR